MGFLEDIKKRTLIYDGSKGYMLQLENMDAGESPEKFNILHPDIVYKIHKSYVESGCDVIQTNTLTGNRILLEKHNLGNQVYKINYEGARLAKKASGGKAYVAASIGPTGWLFEPYGQLSFDKAYEVFKEQIVAVCDGGVDIINFETFTDIAEMRVAIIAAKAVTDIPIIASMTFEKNFRTLMGTTPFACAKIMLALGVDVVGTNCSFGPESMEQIICEMAETGAFVSVKPNAGLPTLEKGVTKYHQNANEFTDIVVKYPKYNARLIGGCCGTTPDFTRLIKESIVKMDYEGKINDRNYLFSLSKMVCIDEKYTVGKIEIKNTMKPDEIKDEMYEVSYDGFDVVEIEYNGNSDDFIMKTLKETQNIIKPPIILSCDNEKAVENALRIYSGIAGIRSSVMNGYGAVLI